MISTRTSVLLTIVVVATATMRLTVGFMAPTQPRKSVYNAVKQPRVARVNIHGNYLKRCRINNSGSGVGALSMSLKPLAIPLMDSGKALARSGELLIDTTEKLDLYGGALSAAGALIRNSGDNIAQAAASCRFKTGTELVCDELRQAATSLTESAEKLQLAVEEAETDNDTKLSAALAQTVSNMEYCGETLEAAGAGIMLKTSLKQIATNLMQCGERLSVLSNQLKEIAPTEEVCITCGQRMAYASEQMIEAANKLQGTPKPKPKGKGWLKG